VTSRQAVKPIPQERGFVRKREKDLARDTASKGGSEGRPQTLLKEMAHSDSWGPGPEGDKQKTDEMLRETGSLGERESYKGDCKKMHIISLNRKGGLPSLAANERCQDKRDIVKGQGATDVRESRRPQGSLWPTGRKTVGG